MNIPGYRIEKEIGRGGMATVYKAVQESLQRTVAVKVMSAALAAEDGFGERFLREARTAASLSHPGILSIHDVGVVDHNYYLAMEYIHGGDLKQRIKKGIPPTQVLAIVRQIAIALGHAHGKGFVHRDVKPENILFREDGTPVLVDFGIAKALGSGTRMTGTGMSIGTPHYMSPEQVRGKNVDGRSDLYSLGVLLFEALTGNFPYGGDDAFAIAYSHINDPIPQLPRDIGKIQPLIDQLLAKDPVHRHDSSASLCETIDALLLGAQLPTQTKNNTDASAQTPPVQQTIVNPRVISETPIMEITARFVDNRDGTITDVSTGLIWQIEDDGRVRNWEQAVSYSKSLQLGGINNWRLPNIEELKSLIDESRRPTIDPMFSNTKSSAYWSASLAYDSSLAWQASFNGGFVNYIHKTNSIYVRCVR